MRNHHTATQRAHPPTHAHALPNAHTSRVYFDTTVRAHGCRCMLRTPPPQHTHTSSHKQTQAHAHGTTHTCTLRHRLTQCEHVPHRTEPSHAQRRNSRRMQRTQRSTSAAGSHAMDDDEAPQEVVALFDFEGRREEELGFSEGDTLYVRAVPRRGDRHPLCCAVPLCHGQTSTLRHGASPLIVVTVTHSLFHSFTPLCLTSHADCHALCCALPSGQGHTFTRCHTTFPLAMVTCLLPLARRLALALLHLFSGHGHIFTLVTAPYCTLTQRITPRFNSLTGVVSCTRAHSSTTNVCRSSKLIQRRNGGWQQTQTEVKRGGLGHPSTSHHSTPLANSTSHPSTCIDT
jgi:hypothetical protein